LFADFFSAESKNELISRDIEGFEDDVVNVYSIHGGNWHDAKSCITINPE
jgi:hypothetical protein